LLVNFGLLLITFGSLLITFGSLLITFGSLLVTFSCLLITFSLLLSEPTPKTGEPGRIAAGSEFGQLIRWQQTVGLYFDKEKKKGCSVGQPFNLFIRFDLF